ncbi:MAG: VOC family protein [Gaiellaceae bacterium]|jgi:predicted enzyme related to lactoylglutathione lyase
MKSGDIVHIEFPSADADRAQRFWSGLFGWSFKDSGMSGMDYRMAQADGEKRVAVFPSEDRSGHPNYYFAVEDIEASLAKVRELGGETEDKMPVPGMGWFASCKDSEGNAFRLYQVDSAAA